MKEILILCAIVALALSSTDAEKLHKTEDGSQYFIETGQKFNWFEALNECARMKMSLVAIDSVDKNMQILNLMKAVPNIADVRLWSAGNDQAVAGRYEWLSTGQSFGYTNWYPGEPNDNTEHCVMISSKNLGWRDAMCSRKLGFICEINSAVKNIKECFDTKTQQMMEKSEQLGALKQSLEILKQNYDQQDRAMKTQEIQVNQTLKVNREELYELKKSYDIQTDQLKQQEQELDVLRKTNETQANQLLKAKNEEDVSLKKSCKDDQSLSETSAKLETLKTSHEEQPTKLKIKSEELGALKKSNELLTNHLFTEKNRILDPLMKSYEDQTHQTVSNKYYFFVQTLNVNGK